MIIRILLAAVAVSALAACGAAKTPQQGPDAKQRASLLKFAQCMRDHGVDMPDPKFSDDGGATVAIGGPGSKPQDQSKVEAAQKACARYQTDAGPKSAPSARDEAKFRKAALKNSECMREHGIKGFPDPQFGDNGTVKMSLPPGIDPQSATFQAAQKACAAAGGGPGLMSARTDGGQ
jgi:predicted small lipoprotein YifL